MLLSQLVLLCLDTYMLCCNVMLCCVVCQINQCLNSCMYPCIHVSLANNLPNVFIILLTFIHISITSPVEK